MSVDEVADELYSLSPEDFTAARVAAAKADKPAAKEINALRKPTVAAWLVNTLARTEPDLLEELLSLGPALAEAQLAGDGTQLRELGDQRRQLVGAVTNRAFAAADREPTAALRSEVESTLDAALADPATADAVRSGRLTRTLSYAGFGGVDLDDAVAVAPARRKLATVADPAAKPARSKDILAAEARAQAAAGDLDDAVRACQQTQQEQDQAEQSERRAATEVADAEQTRQAARGTRSLAEQQARHARRRTEQAGQAVEVAQKKAEKARATLDQLRRG